MAWLGHHVSPVAQQDQRIYLGAEGLAERTAGLASMANVPGGVVLQL
jgi:hypothetical protein